jgi:hypothetical protein
MNRDRVTALSQSKTGHSHRNEYRTSASNKSLASDERRPAPTRRLAIAYLAGVVGVLVIAGVVAVLPAARVAGRDLFPVVPYHSDLKAPPASVKHALWLLETNLEGTLPPLLGSRWERIAGAATASQSTPSSPGR